VALDTWLAFFVASWLISLSPGAGALSCMAAGLRFGYRRGVFNIFGLQTGIVLQVALCGLGLGALLAASTTAFAAIKWLGVAYLVWLGVRQFRAAGSVVELGARGGNAPTPAREGTAGRLYLQGLLVNITNPKGVVFMLAVLPQFIDPARPQALQYAVCAGTLVFTDLVVMSGYTGLAARGLRLLSGPRQIQWINRMFGGLFVAAGVLLATVRRA